MKANLTPALLSILTLSFSLVMESTAEDHEMSATEQVLKYHLDAFAAGDGEKILKDYTEESFVITPDGLFRGVDELRERFTGFVDGLPPGRQFTMMKQVVEGEYAYIVWSAGLSKMMIPYATDTFHIVDGKIVAQTFVAQVMKMGQS
tara:strand:+ start:785 stop:1225 length:441 start_codon:yes stop_codon:yes gene_type:complete